MPTGRFETLPAVLALALTLAGVATAAEPLPATGAEDSPPVAAPAPATAAPNGPRPAASRRCTGWAAHTPKETKEVAFHGEHLMQRSQQEMEVAYQMWDIEEALDQAAAREACRAKARELCTRESAAPGYCRFEVHPGLQNGGWDAAATTDEPPPPPPKAKGKAKGKGKGKGKGKAKKSPPKL